MIIMYINEMKELTSTVKVEIILVSTRFIKSGVTSIDGFDVLR